MKRILFVTVGTTAVREELGATRDDHSDLQMALGAFMKRNREWSARELTVAHETDLFKRIVEAHEEIWQFNIDDIFDLEKSTSGEMTSTWLLAAHPESGLGGRFRPGEDRVVLLSSDTAVGYLSACVNAELMHRHLLEPACNCEVGFGTFSGRQVCQAVQIEVVEGMEARRGFPSLLPRFKEICERQAEGFEVVLFNITGGFKGAIPALTWLATSVFNRKRPAIYYQYEEVRAAMRLQFREEPGEAPEESVVVPEPHIRVRGRR